MPREPKPTTFTDAQRGERLQRVLADAGVGSRRACESLIENGDVEVNGVLVTELPAWVDPEVDHIVVSGRPIPKPERKTYILLNKPPRTLSTVKDEPGADRRTVAELVDHPLVSRLFPVGRLDYDTVGLVLMTNDGELANRLTHPRYGVAKTYRVQVKGELDDDAVRELERGIYLAERKAGQTVGAKRTSRVEIALVHRERGATVLELTLREGRNRQVRRMMAAVGYPVRKLERVAMGPVKLKGVARGAWRELTQEEIRALRKAAADGRSGGDGKPKSKASPKTGTHAGSRQSAGKPGARRGVDRSGTPMRRNTRDQSASRGGSGVANDRYSGQASESDAKRPGIRRRTMKNAINRATNPKSPPRKPREGDGPTEA